MTESSTRFRFPLLAAGILGLSGVTLGAMGAHALAVRLAARGMTHAWETAADYQLFHAVALLGVAGWLRADETNRANAGANRLVWAAWCWTAGIVLFSGSLYLLAAGGPRWLGPITPFGGVALMLGWVFGIAAAFSRKE